MGEKEYQQVSNKMKKRHEYRKCECGCNNDLTTAIENNDYDKDPVRKGILYIYCQQCSNPIEIKKK